VVGGSTLTLVKGALKIMAWTKAKTAVVVGVSVLLMVGITVEVMKEFMSDKSSRVVPKQWVPMPRVPATNLPESASIALALGNQGKIPIATTVAVTNGIQDQRIVTSIQGRSIASLVAAVEIGGFPSQKGKSALDTLISAGPKIMPELALILQEAPPEQQARAVFVMGGICYRNPDAPEVRAAIPALVVSAENKYSEVRIYSVQALGAVGKAASVATPVLVRLTKDPSASVRMCAVESLRRIGANSSDSVAALTAASSDESSDVRITASNALEIVRAVGK
jgi:hypothetical protein